MPAVILRQHRESPIRRAESLVTQLIVLYQSMYVLDANDVYAPHDLQRIDMPLKILLPWKTSMNDQGFLHILG
jgi:hypothetical protein